MKRVIVTPAVLAPSALAELKDWLGITLGSDDAQLTALLHAALEICESFTGTMPLQQGCEETVLAVREWQALATHPVQGINALFAVQVDGSRLALPTSAATVSFYPDGGARLRLIDPSQGTRFVVGFTAGIAPDWTSLPDPLRHGVLRFAAHQYREREELGVQSATPPAAVAALWRPWRRMRLT